MAKTNAERQRAFQRRKATELQSLQAELQAARAMCLRLITNLGAATALLKACGESLLAEGFDTTAGLIANRVETFAGLVGEATAMLEVTGPNAPQESPGAPQAETVQ